MDYEHIVIIGGNRGGARAAFNARRNCAPCHISVFESGNQLPYSSCDFIYYLSGLIKDPKKLHSRSQKEFDNYGIKLHLNHEVKVIDSKNKKLLVANTKTQKNMEINYDKLIIATGSKIIKPERIEGIDTTEGVFGLKTFDDVIKIDKYIKANKPQKVLIAGGGYIGAELAGAFKKRHMEIDIIESKSHMLEFLDKDMAGIVQKHLKDEGINIYTSEFVNKISSQKGKIIVQTNKQIHEADLMITAIGIRPNTTLAEESGIEINEENGAIAVNTRMQTNIQDIYAIGDCAEKYSLVQNKKIWHPAASITAKEAQIAGKNATGGNEQFPGILETSIVPISSYNVAKTGLNEKQSQYFEYESVILNAEDASTLCLKNKELTIKLIADKENHKILGAQIIGKGDVSKRIDIIATAIAFDATVEELESLDLSYAPYYSTEFDIIFQAAENLSQELSEKVKSIMPEELSYRLENDGKDLEIIDIRDVEEFTKKHLRSAKNIPIASLLKEKKSFDQKKEIILYCKNGKESYLTSKILINSGNKNVEFLEGGLDTILEINENLAE